MSKIQQGRRWASKVMMALVVTASAPAQAQLAPGYSGQSGTRQATDEEYLWALGELGACLARTKTKQAEAFLASGRGTPAEDAAVKRLVGYNTACLSLLNEMGVERTLLRGTIAEAFYKKLAPAPLPEAASSAAAAPGRMSAASLKALGYDRFMEGVTACWAARRPALVHSLLTETKLGSQSESDAVAAMGSVVAECLPANLKLKFHPSELRLALAEAAYKRVSAKVRTGD
ncbi:MAG TPA: hypothetical protein VGB48_02340 [Allosphingosinicella sp.]|jgi:hypothetical protein